VQERFFRPCRQYDWASVCMAYFKRVLRYHSQTWKHRACTGSHIHKIRNSVFLLRIIHITHKLILASRSFVFKAYENKAPNSVPKFMTEFTEQVNIRPDQELWYKSGLHFDIYKRSFQQNISFRLYTLLKTKILFNFFYILLFSSFNHNICTLTT